MCGLAWLEIHWNSIWLRARSHMASHYTWGSMVTLHDFGGVLGRPLDTFFGALTIFMVTALDSCVKWPLWTLRSWPIMLKNLLGHCEQSCLSRETWNYLYTMEDMVVVRSLPLPLFPHRSKKIGGSDVSYVRVQRIGVGISPILVISIRAYLSSIQH